MLVIVSVFIVPDNNSLNQAVSKSYCIELSLFKQGDLSCNSNPWIPCNQRNPWFRTI